ncbi:hypothetical protein EXN66_Car018871 [Channa argus]|uniref:Uncharacterized protein n=1 Tax=Channa argus TaxID=215402 RepID=A0A6G1QLJ5_CHAAH|nr:hypothetical protein EXN66_Car018871 [Channa argus]
MLNSFIKSSDSFLLQHIFQTLRDANVKYVQPSSLWLAAADMAGGLCFCVVSVPFM